METNEIQINTTVTIKKDQLLRQKEILTKQLETITLALRKKLDEIEEKLALFE